MSNWTSVEQRLPQDKFPKLYYNSKTNEFGLCYYDGNNFLRIQGNKHTSKMNDGEVTHWLEIPDPPMKKEFKHKGRNK